jgi:peptide/nickel transport system substrate-binding protein
MRIRPGLGTALTAIVLLAACTPGTSGPSPSAGAPAAGATPERPSRIVVAIQNDVSVLATKLQIGPGVSGGPGHDLSGISNNPLVVLDGNGVAHPRLAAELPSRERGTWTVNADGTMRTTWKIRPNALWHDGTPVSSDDFIFALKVYLDPEIQVIHRNPERIIEQIEPIDQKTFVIHWTQLYRGADRLIVEQLEPLPSHILASLYDQQDKVAFQNASFWTTTSYVGNGPFVLTDRVEGVQRTYRAFDRYMLGKPRAGELVVQITPDQNVVLAALMSDAVDVTTSTTLNQQTGLTLQQEWDRTGGGSMVRTLANFLFGEFQHHPDRVRQPALLDPRVRRAIILAIDRESLNEVIAAGQTQTPQLPMHPADPWYARALQGAPPYPYDVTRSLQFLEEAGWVRRSNALMDASGKPFEVNIRTVRRADNETIVRIWASYLTDLGMSVTQTTLSVAEDADRQQRAEFPGLGLGSIRTMEMPDGLSDFISAECPTAENQFVGRNRRCWRNPEFDGLFALGSRSLDDAVRADSTVHMLQLAMQDAAMIPLIYQNQNIGVRKGVVGVSPYWHAQKGGTWFVHEWGWSS